MSKPIVFLGGTCQGWDWRDDLSRLILARGLNTRMTLFNPVVDDWNEEAKMREDEAKSICGIMLFFLNDDGKNIYSIAELVHHSYANPDAVTVGYYADFGASVATDRSYAAVLDLARQHGAITNGVVDHYGTGRLDKPAVIRSLLGTLMAAVNEWEKRYGVQAADTVLETA